jgi:hypothetical protein
MDVTQVLRSRQDTKGAWAPAPKMDDGPVLTILLGERDEADFASDYTMKDSRLRGLHRHPKRHCGRSDSPVFGRNRLWLPLEEQSQRP